MDSDRELMRRAADALRELLPPEKDDNHDGHDARDVRTWRATLKDLRARLAQPELEPVAWADKAMELATDFSVESLRLGSYERKDVYENSCRASWQTIDLRHKREVARERLRQHLYTAPPARQWVDLTDEDKQDLYSNWGVSLAAMHFVSERLKAKNGGTE